jgi:hypothetical protein
MRAELGYFWKEADEKVALVFVVAVILRHA